jgi:hypothetical protein
MSAQRLHALENTRLRPQFQLDDDEGSASLPPGVYEQDPEESAARAQLWKLTRPPRDDLQSGSEMECGATVIARGWPPRGADTAPGAECQAVFSQVMFLHISKTLSESVRCLFYSDHNRRNTEKDRSWISIELCSATRRPG